MHDSSIFKVRIDFEKSRGSYIYDKNTQRLLLDFFGMYSSLPLGYSHPIFNTPEFQQEYLRIAGVKVANCEIISDEAQEFLGEFSAHPSMAPFQHFHFCCTGALAIESAIKIAIDQKGSPIPQVLSFKESFHGINSYGGFVTDRFHPVSVRLNGMPELGWRKLTSPKIHYKDNAVDEAMTRRAGQCFLEEIEEAVKTIGASHIAALLVEPVQATYGDSYYPMEFFQTVRRLCDRHGICLIFDEIQTG
ncbi:MAG: aminotransferase class III-fold pyridoxal phosphate-dependent enzyme, partial [Candidatus Omnitrophica bacterium]|nr:aminotransferase class III-fold pyridoxal phosphate-dependent enzyme [Candidatus Omnitrophota bacterium]